MTKMIGLFIYFFLLIFFCPRVSGQQITSDEVLEGETKTQIIIIDDFSTERTLSLPNKNYSHWVLTLKNPGADKKNYHKYSSKLDSVTNNFKLFEKLSIVYLSINRNSEYLIDSIFRYYHKHKIHRNDVYTYLNILDGLHNVIKSDSMGSKPKVISISLQPSVPYEYHEHEAINIATKAATIHGNTVVVSVGNFGGFGENTMNPWSVAPWVIGVGAATADGMEKWEYSSIGIKGSSTHHPTIVAHGVNMELSLKWLEEPIDSSIIVTGTSFATPGIAVDVAYLYRFLDTIPSFVKLQKGCIEKINQDRLDIKLINYYPIVVKWMLKDMAMPMDRYELHEVGAGFIGKDTVIKYVAEFDCNKLQELLIYLRDFMQ